MSTGALARAIDLAKGQTELARRVNEHVSPKMRIGQGQIWSWLNRTRTVPAEYAIPLEKALAGAISRHEFRPDIYPREDQ